ncbi:hypothetical protein D3C71_1940950 [compost metagenome]
MLKALAVHGLANPEAVIQRQTPVCTFNLVLKTFKRLIHPGAAPRTAIRALHPAFYIVHRKNLVAVRMTVAGA